MLGGGRQNGSPPFPSPRRRPRVKGSRGTGSEGNVRGSIGRVAAVRLGLGTTVILLGFPRFARWRRRCFSSGGVSASGFRCTRKGEMNGSHCRVGGGGTAGAFFRQRRRPMLLLCCRRRKGRRTLYRDAYGGSTRQRQIQDGPGRQIWRRLGRRRCPAEGTLVLIGISIIPVGALRTGPFCWFFGGGRKGRIRRRVLP